MKDEIRSLYDELKKGVNVSRLKEISVDIIARYKKRDRGGLLFYARLLGLEATDMHINRLFAKIIQYYHPDKIINITREIDAFFGDKRLDALNGVRDRYLFTGKPQNHSAAEDSEIVETYAYSDEDFGYREKDRFDGDGFQDDDDFTFDDDEPADEGEEEYGFIQAVNSLFFGNLDYAVGINDLYDLEGELDLSDFEIGRLDGIEHCLNISSLNLSGNNLVKIDQIALLAKLEFLFASENHISSIDCLAGLRRLKELDVSFNEIDDISVLLELENLVYVNVMGNPLSDTGICQKLAARGVVVIY